MNWDSFVPDMIVGVVTAVLVGLFLLVVERRLAQRARGDLIADQQRRTAETAALLFRTAFMYTGSKSAALLPAGNNMERLRSLVHTIPQGAPSRPVPAIDWAIGAVTTFENLEAIADSIVTRATEYQRGGGTAVIEARFYWRIAEVVRRGDSYFEAWWEPGMMHRDLGPIATDLESDQAFKDEVTQYLYYRRLLDAYRTAFLACWDGVSVRANEITMNWLAGTPYYWPKSVIAERKRNKALKEATIASEIEADAIVAPHRGGC